MLQIVFNTKDDFITYLKHLIILASKGIKRYEEQINQLGSYIEDKKLIERPNCLISSKEYENFKSMLMFSHGYLLNLFGDQSEMGISYQNYRKQLKKKDRTLNFNFLELTEEQKAELNKVTTARDWSHHIPASLMHAQNELALERNLAVVNPIFYSDFQKYRGIWLVDLYRESVENLENFKRLLELLKEDYSVITGDPCMVVPITFEIREIDDLKIPKISYDMLVPSYVQA